MTEFHRPHGHWEFLHAVAESDLTGYSKAVLYGMAVKVDWRRSQVYCGAWSQIASLAGCSRATAKRAIGSLDGWVEVKPGKHSRAANSIKLLIPCRGAECGSSCPSGQSEPGHRDPSEDLTVPSGHCEPSLGSERPVTRVTATPSSNKEDDPARPRTADVPPIDELVAHLAGRLVAPVRPW